MSDALNYLIKARPEAMRHYFRFLKDTGRHLDPKTRNLISIITKVHAQTERGLRQYLTRALREGCTAVEVIDALLMAFPALGLTRIVWAIDVILAMKLPEFELDALAAQTAANVREPTADAGGEEDPPAAASSVAAGARALAPEAARWHDVVDAEAIAVGGVARVECDGRGLFVYRAPGEYRVYDSLCPHQTTNIPQLAISGRVLTCPKHEWQFDLESGACIAKGDQPLRRWESRVEGARVQAWW